MANPTRILTAALLLAAACSKNDDASKASAIPPMANAPAAPAPAPAPAAVPTPPPPPAPPEAEPAKPADPNATITGQITLPGAMKSHVSPSDTLFLVARRISDTPGVRGSLVAVKKLSAAKFPIDFTMSAADMPFQGGTFEGDLTLSIRDDKDNDPMTRLKGDVFGTLPKVHVGARGVKLALDQLQKEDESLTGANPHGGPMGGGGPMGAMPPGHPGSLPPGHP
jgi:cytochrome c-type biogenesis protein CcmH